MSFAEDLELLAKTARLVQGDEKGQVQGQDVVAANARATVALSQRIEALAAVIISPGIEWEWIEDATRQARNNHEGGDGMKIYLAARYSRRAELLVYAGQLREAGHEVTSTWLQGEHQLANRHNTAGAVEAATDTVPMVAQPFALADYADVWAADVVVSFTEAPRSGASRGGRHVEFGLALAWNKSVVIVGPRENVFHTLPQVVRLNDFQEAWEWLGRSVLKLRRLDEANRAG